VAIAVETRGTMEFNDRLRGRPGQHADGRNEQRYDSWRFKAASRCLPRSTYRRN